MNFIKTYINGVIVIEPKVVTDDRGYFMEEFRQNVFDQEVGHIEFDTEYELEATQGTVSNPFHECDGVAAAFEKQCVWQTDSSADDSAWPATLLRCVIGKVLVTVTDERNDSPTLGRLLSIELSDSNHLLCLIPRGVSYSLTVLSPKALLQLRCSRE